MNQAFSLFRLQQIDSQIDQVDARVAELDRLLAGNEAVLSARQRTQDTTHALERARKALKEAEFAVREQSLKIEQIENTLYSGTVRNPKELQDLQKDIASLKKHLALLEDRQLEKMMAAEEDEATDQEAIKELTKAEAAFAEHTAGWRGERDGLLHNRERLLSERSAALTLTSPADLAVYDRLRKRKNGLAVTTVRDGACVLCGAVIRPNEIQLARVAPELVFCSSCGRILYSG